MKFPLIRHTKSIASLLSTCDGDAIDIDTAKKLLNELEPILARLEVQNYSHKLNS